jgi:aryl-alcohol dehydrogenase-like predicted oxidoreductase
MRFSARRPLGRTGFAATVIGAGDLADRALGIETCAATLRRALDAGVNLVDTAPAYERGLSERIVGAALLGRREGVFVIDKIDELGAPVAPQIGGSIDRLGFAPDAFVFHNVSRLEDWEAIARPGGPMEELGGAVRAGHCRFRGASCHHPGVARAAIASGLCDVVMFAIGPYVDPGYVDLLPLARERGVGTVCFKTFGAGMLVADTDGYGQPLSDPSRAGNRLTVADCLRATLTYDPDVALLGLSNAEEQDAAFDAVERYTRPTPEELAELRARAAHAIRGKGKTWWDPIPST